MADKPAAKKVNRSEHTKKALIEAMHKSLGVVSDACASVGISRTTFYEYLNSDPDFAAACAQSEDIALDLVESKAYEQIQNGNTAMIIFYLKTKGKRRGFIERQEVDHSGAIAIEQITGMKVI